MILGQAKQPHVHSDGDLSFIADGHAWKPGESDIPGLGHTKVSVPMGWAWPIGSVIVCDECGAHFIAERDRLPGSMVTVAVPISARRVRKLTKEQA